MVTLLNQGVVKAVSDEWVWRASYAIGFTLMIKEHDHAFKIPSLVEETCDNIPLIHKRSSNEITYTNNMNDTITSICL